VNGKTEIYAQSYGTRATLRVQAQHDQRELQLSIDDLDRLILDAESARRVLIERRRLQGEKDFSKCTVCGTMPTKSQFRDELSLVEYGISGMCAGCQKEVFGY